MGVIAPGKKKFLQLDYKLDIGTSKSSVLVACFLPGRAKDLLAPRNADKSLTRPTSRCVFFDGENISFDASLVIYIYIYIVLIFLQL